MTNSLGIQSSANVKIIKLFPPTINIGIKCAKLRVKNDVIIVNGCAQIIIRNPIKYDVKSNIDIKNKTICKKK